ncbi:MAG: YeeE/YedE family protein, partial [Betaproteobacteria bacterium]|nr:YeeE/YedE family protein [Betaproteobacteria bacterium]
VRLGGGSLKALVVLLVMGLAAFATLKGLTAVIRVATVDSVVLAMPSGSSLPDWLSAAWGLPLPWTGLVLGLGTGAALILWALSGRGFLQADNLLAGLGLGLIVTAMWWVTGSLGFVAEHPETLQETFLATSSGRIEALSFVAPVAHTLDWLLFFSDKNKQLSVGVVAVLGVLLGSCLCALAMKNFRWEGFAGTEDLVNHLVGALLMGVGGVTAMGCTIGQGLSGLSTLSLSSFVALAAIMAGAVAGLRYQVWRLDRQA